MHFAGKLLPTVLVVAWRIVWHDRCLAHGWTDAGGSFNGVGEFLGFDFGVLLNIGIPGTFLENVDVIHDAPIFDYDWFDGAAEMLDVRLNDVFISIGFGRGKLL